MLPAAPPTGASEKEAAAYMRGRFRNPSFPPAVATHQTVLHLAYPPEGFLQPGIFLVGWDERGEKEVVLWIRRRIAYDRRIVVFEVGLVDDQRGSGLLFADIRSVDITVEMVARLDSGTGSVPGDIWHRVLACGHSRVRYRQLCTLQDIEAIRREVVRREGM